MCSQGYNSVFIILIVRAPERAGSKDFDLALDGADSGGREDGRAGPHPPTPARLHQKGKPAHLVVLHHLCFLCLIIKLQYRNVYIFNSLF